MDRKTDWIQTYLGNRFWPLEPSVDDIEIEDIAHALSVKCRFGGHCTTFYSVAQHSVLVSENVPEEDRYWALMHDASEAYLPDVPRPVKPFLTGFREVEERMMNCIADRFFLPWPEPESVGLADSLLLVTEQRDLMKVSGQERQSTKGITPLPNRIIPWTWQESKERFLETFGRLHH